eukprot:TRINITY_DN31877_c0_g1_i1.p1 TRINITY_DN31877_c0_g1~~TRINITY_DN31877_c0_g1_i1.p1  ORF type:complete len:264 (-),score=42.40 TRINITY_DN31877_c0_g1_i1:1301-2092(-)
MFLELHFTRVTLLHTTSLAMMRLLVLLLALVPFLAQADDVVHFAPTDKGATSEGEGKGKGKGKSKSKGQGKGKGSIHGLPVPDNACTAAGFSAKDMVKMKTGILLPQFSSDDRSKFIPLLTSLPFGSVLPEVKRVFIVQHGVGRKYERYFCQAYASLKSKGLTDSTLVIGTYYPEEELIGTNNSWSSQLGSTSTSLYWSTGSWVSGALDDADIMSSYAVHDTLLAKVESMRDKELPNLEATSLLGFSGGCQLMSRWAFFFSSA